MAYRPLDKQRAIPVRPSGRQAALARLSYQKQGRNARKSAPGSARGVRRRSRADTYDERPRSSLLGCGLAQHPVRAKKRARTSQEPPCGVTTKEADCSKQSQSPGPATIGVTCGVALSQPATLVLNPSAQPILARGWASPGPMRGLVLLGPVAPGRAPEQERARGPAIPSGPSQGPKPVSRGRRSALSIRRRRS